MLVNRANPSGSTSFCYSQHSFPIALLAVVIFGLLGFFVDHVLLGFQINSHLHSVAVASIAGLGVGAAVWATLAYYHRQLRREGEEIRKVAELNHHLRNALQIIADAHYLGSDTEHKKMMLETVKRIDEKLKELYPTAVEH